MQPITFRLPWAASGIAYHAPEKQGLSSRPTAPWKMGLCGQAFLTRVSPMTCAHLLGTPTTPGTLCSQMLPDELIFLFFFYPSPRLQFQGSFQRSALLPQVPSEASQV